MLSFKPRHTTQRSDNDRCAVILAGGDGTRLRAFTRRITGDERPKQFCPIFGGKTLWTKHAIASLRQWPVTRHLLCSLNRTSVSTAHWQKRGRN